MNPCLVLCTFYLAYRAPNSFYTLQGKSKLLAIRGKLEMTNWQEELYGYDPYKGLWTRHLLLAGGTSTRKSSKIFEAQSSNFD